ncbi:MAG: 4'-phosphopantetheinyl transferase superfamily protein [Methyloprofundus sp.]|nr:4'-phosphopantetheinyl transferase superfamily protein [Methyloprofundus sp.]MDT8425638.1 4'-phosphopantetheinyl transferase superfamily protein [Methyloprofundus sp.]
MNNSEIDVYTTTLVSSFYHRQAYYLSLLDVNELAIAKRFKLAQVRDSYIVAHGLLRETLARYVNVSAAQLRLTKTALGKPFLADYPELSFNMSHSGNSLAIAVAQQCQLGIDVEYYKARDTWAGMVRKCFAPEEAKYWHSLDQSEQGRAFYQFWVRKEAFVKADGKGITLGLNQCVINPSGLNRFLRVPEACGAAQLWRIDAFSLSVDVMAAVVCDQQEAVLRFLDFSIFQESLL